jgi:predicted dehydrogenase
MVSETAFFVKDVFGPKGSVSIVAKSAASTGQSADIDAHTKTDSLRVHRSERDAQGKFIAADEIITLADEPNHDELCRREQAFFLRAIQEDLDLSVHWQSALDSLRIVLAADQSAREGRTVEL